MGDVLTTAIQFLEACCPSPGVTLLIWSRVAWAVRLVNAMLLLSDLLIRFPNHTTHNQGWACFPLTNTHVMLFCHNECVYVCTCAVCSPRQCYFQGGNHNILRNRGGHRLQLKCIKLKLLRGQGHFQGGGGGDLMHILALY